MLLNKNILAIGIVSLFIVSSVAPMAIGYKVVTAEDDSELDKMLDDLRFLCTTLSGFNEQKYNYYKEQLLAGYSSETIRDNTVFELEKEEMMIPVNLPLTSMVGGPKDTPWPMKCHDVHHTSQSPYSTAYNPGIEKWRFECDWLDSSPVIDNDGTIYFGCGDRYFYALFPNGSLKWKYKLGGIVGGSSPAIAEDGTFYIGSWDDYLYAINPNGTKKWKFHANAANIHSSPAIAEDGTIYFGTLWSLGDGGKIHAVNPDGTEKWRYQTGYAVTSSPAVGDDGTVYCGSDDRYLYALYPNGTLRWRFGTGDWVAGSPSIGDDGIIYFGSYDDYLYALYPNGTLKWKVGTSYGIAGAPAIGNDGTIYAATNKLRAFYPNGTLKWSFKFGEERFVAWSSPAISADGTIYVGTNIGEVDGGEIIAVNTDGTERWRKKIANEWVDSSPCIAEDGTVYIGSSSMKRIGPGNRWDSVGYLHAFGPVESNKPPGTPTITGPTSGKVGKEYDHWFKAIDPDRNPIRLYIEWGDGTNTGWIEEAASGEEVVMEHTWSKGGTYTISAKAKDVMGEESDWATFEVKIEGKGKEVQQMLFYRLLEQFPILQKILLLQR